MKTRTERKNDDLILATLGEIKIDVAVIKSKSEATEDHLKNLNSKVATQEGRTQAHDAALNLINQNIANLQANDQKAASFIERNWEKFFWTLVIPGIIYFVLNK